MKRTALLTATLAITLLVAASMVMAQPPTPSVPNLINFQGRLTDNLGNPVANGAHTVNFYIFPVRTGGLDVWNEATTQTTTGGLFTTQLGLVNPLPQTLFQDYDSLFLEIVADAQLISPRTLLSSTPSTRVADNLEVQSPYFPGQVAVRSEPYNHGLSTYGSDGLEQIRLWGPSWGEMLLYDVDPSNDWTTMLTSTDSYFGPTGKGGALYLANDGGLFTIRLHGDATGDASVELPTDAINSGEILDEPGIAHSFTFGGTTLLAGTAAIESVSITYPTSGFVVLEAHGYFYFTPFVTGTVFGARAYINTVAGAGDFDNFAIETIESSLPSYGGDQGYRSFSLTKVEAVAPGTVKYYLNADRFGGAGGSAVSINRIHLTAQFFPTNYGTVISTIAAQPRVGGNITTSADVAGTDQPSEVQVTTVEDHNARLEAERAKQMAELEARIKKLEGQAAGQLPGQGARTPRKER